MLIMWLGMAAAAPAQSIAKTPGEAIVVTGERVKRSLKQTSSSVSVATQREIAATGADRVDQILAETPNVQLGNGSQGPAIRGLDTTGALQALPAFLGGNRARTTLIVDGRRTTYSEFVFGAAPVWDVNRIEIFRSPQTTTQGQNSIAGAIFVDTNDPGFSPEGRARVIAGNYRTRELSAVVSAPLSGDVALRLAGDVRYQRTTSRINDVIEGGSPNHDVYGVARAKLLIKPRAMPGSRLLLTFTHNQSQAPQIVGITAPFKRRKDASGVYGTFRIKVDALTAQAQQKLSSNLTADVTVTAGHSDARRLALSGFGEADVRGRDWSAEAVFNWSAAGPLSAVGGFSRTHLNLKQSIDLSRLSGIGRFRDAQDSDGVFGEASLKVGPRAIVTAGLRYQQDRQQRAGALDSAAGPIPLDFDRTFHAWLPKLSLSYDVSDQVRTGVLVEKAYNPGGTTLRFDTGRPDNFAAEKLWDYEAFVRAQLAPGVQFNGNIFYYAMRDAQRSEAIRIRTAGGLTVGFADLFNAPKARSHGAEAELSWQASRTFSARFSAGLLKSKLIDAGAAYPEFTGNEFARSPHLTLAAAADWQATGQLRLSAQARRHSRYYADDVNGPDVTIPAAALVDARAEYRIGKVTLSAYVRNLFNKFALIDRLANISASAEDPRMVGIGIETAF